MRTKTDTTMAHEANWRETSMIRRVHGICARVLGVFILAHLFNHLNLLGGVERHLAVMDAMRSIYRLVLIEYALYGLFLVQIILGLMLARKNWKPDNGWSWAQVVSGLIIAFFLVQHLGASIYVRSSVPFIDTDVHWAASVVSQLPLSAYFIPYYFAGVLAVFVHIAAAFHFGNIGKSIALPKITLGVGFITAAVIIAALTGIFEPIVLPENYERYLQELPFS